MTRYRVTKIEKAKRQQWAVAQIDKGVSFSELTSLTAEIWGFHAVRPALSSLQPIKIGLLLSMIRTSTCGIFF